MSSAKPAHAALPRMNAAPEKLEHRAVICMNSVYFVMQRHGTIDVLVNNAGVASWTGQGPTDGAQQTLHIRSA